MARFAWKAGLRFSFGFDQLGRGPRAGLGIEETRNRTLPSTFSVLNTNDSGAGSLRQAILNANANLGVDTIAFAAGNGSISITPTSPLPTITDSVTIDGTTQPGWTNAPIVVLDGSSAGSSANGLSIIAPSVIVRGLVINHFNGDGILIMGSGAIGDLVAGNYIGTDVTGLKAVANAGQGVDITEGASDNLVGGSMPSARNIISGNAVRGVYLTGAGTTGNRVQGNYIGTDKTGSAALGNGLDGVSIDGGAAQNWIGTDGDGSTDSSEGNVISANQNNGTGILAANSNVIAGNLIGTDVTGTRPLSNRYTGVWIGGGSRFNLVGTHGKGVSDSFERNVVASNGADGVELTDGGTDNNSVAGNYVGIDISGSKVLGNGQDGVLIVGGASSNRIGTDGIGSYAIDERNVIAGNGYDGVALEGGGTTNNIVAGNYVGSDYTGEVALGGNHSGVTIGGGASDNLVGTNGSGVGDASERNVISGNLWSGVYITDAGTSENIVAGNYIGVDAQGTSDLGNGQDGVAVVNAAASNRIGTDGINQFAVDERNVIAGNGYDGVLLEGMGVANNIVAGNYIGTDYTGKVALGGNHFGVKIDGGAARNLVGTNGDGVGDDAERNVIAGNQWDGVFIAGTGTNDNVVAGNNIGVDVSGINPLGNNYGVRIDQGSQSNIVGISPGGNADERNIISGNRDDGVLIIAAGTSFNSVAGNYIGTDVSGRNALPNELQGVTIAAGATGNLIGGSAADSRNIISGNDIRGVYLTGIGTSNNRVQGNYIGTNVTGGTALGNGWDGISIDGGASGNWIGTDGDGVSDASEGNVVSANQNNNIGLLDASSNVIAGNYIGTDAGGTIAFGAKFFGIWLGGSSQFNRIGTDGDGISDEPERNVIAGNGYDGVFIGSSNSNTVAGNFIGVDVSGTNALGNNYGIRIDQGSQSNTIGVSPGGNSDERNIVSGNRDDGILVIAADTSFNTIAGNYIGTNAAGTTSVGNGWWGIGVNAPANQIGGSSLLGMGNLVSGNNQGGITVQGKASVGDVVQGNYVGTSADGASALGNAFSGILVADWGVAGDEPTNTLIGGGAAGLGNVVSANGNYGIWVSGAGTTGTIVSGNLIGTNAAGAAALGNAWSDVFINAGASDTIIGTNGDGNHDVAERNVISGSRSQYGVQIEDSATTSNIVAGNYIGTNASGTSALPNNIGVLIWNSPANKVGTNGTDLDSTDESNLISGNTFAGVYLYEAGTSQNTIAGNSIGLSSSGTPLGNSYGVYINSASNNTIGGTTALGNTIAGNTAGGVFIVSGAGNAIRANSIYSNGIFEIELVPGANLGQNPPVIAAAYWGPLTGVAGTLHSAPNSAYTVDVYASSASERRRWFCRRTARSWLVLGDHRCCGNCFL